jgi:alkylation response protein AidB-like acyl-CoA dehydrogenase
VAAYISIHNMCVWMIDRFGSEAQRRLWCPELVGLGNRASYCLTEPGVGSDAAALTTRAERDGEGWRLTGQKQFISGAGSSAVYLVMARTGGPGAKGISCFLMPGDAAGLSFGVNERKMGWNAQPTRAVIMDGVRLGPEALLGAEGLGFSIAMAGLDGGRLNIAACSLGGASAALAKAQGYMAERRAFGKRLAEMQALQFRLADMKIGLEAARSFLWRAAWALDTGAEDATVLCAAAKRFVTDAGFEIANEALQLHGGYGYLADYGLEKIVRDLRVHQILEGTNEIMRLIVARSLLEEK